MAKGRPARSRFERTRIKIWSLAVHLQVIAKKRSLESLLGEDGKQESMWDRYNRGLAAPSETRLDRIEKVLRGTAQYYRSPIWRLYSPKKWTRLEFEMAIRELDPLFRYALRPQKGKYRLTSRGAERAEKKIARRERRREARRGKNPPPWQEMFDDDGDLEPEEFELPEPHPPKLRFYFAVILARALEALADPKLGMSALNTIFLMLIELHKHKNMKFYYVMCLAWTEAEKLRHRHPLLKHLPLDLFHQALLPAVKLFQPLFLENIRSARGLPAGAPIQGSDIFWALESEPHWKETARKFELIR